MADPNGVGPIGAFLTVYGFARVGVRRASFVTGLAIVILADSRVAYAAVAVGLFVLLLVPGWGVPLWRITAAKATAAVVGVLVGVRLLVDLAANPAGTITMTVAQRCGLTSYPCGTPRRGSESEPGPLPGGHLRVLPEWAVTVTTSSSTPWCGTGWWGCCSAASSGGHGRTPVRGARRGGRTGLSADGNPAAHHVRIWCSTGAIPALPSRCVGSLPWSAGGTVPAARGHGSPSP